MAFSGTLAQDGPDRRHGRRRADPAPKIVAETGPALHAIGRPGWSADGRTIAFQAAEGLFTFPPRRHAGEDRPPGTYRAPADPAYSPDGRLLAFSALDASDDRRVYVKNLETT